ncbi:hypothetical protein [Variovorax sp. R-27]|uniref:hypothetical protein n=1 Tax=Variovorax sp. R-27 TaxID=3404058 RepID=UPI003CF70C2E
MADTSTNALARTLTTPRRLKFDPSAVREIGESEHKIAAAIAAETEAEREKQRARLGKMYSLLGPETDYVDTMHWDEFLMSPMPVIACAARAGVSPVALLDFIGTKCSPSNWRTMFWIQAWFELLSQSKEEAARDTAVAVDAIKQEYAAKEDEAARLRVAPAAKARRQLGEKNLARIAETAEPLRGKMSKEQAAVAIAQALHLSSATVRKRLIELFPRDAWHAPKK